MANRTFNNVKLNLTLKTTSTRANLSSSSEDIAVQMGKIQKWFNDFSWAVWNAPFVTVYGTGNAVTNIDVTGPNDTDDPTQVGKISVYKGNTFIPRAGMADIGVLSLGLPASNGRFGSIWATDIHNESTMIDYQTPLMIYHPYRSEMDVDEGEARGDIQIGYGFSNEISEYVLSGMNLYRSPNSTTYHHVGSTIISTGYEQYYAEMDGKWQINAVGNKTISVVIPGSSDSVGGSFNPDTYAAVWNSVYNGFTDPPMIYYNEYKDFGADTQFLINGVSFKVTATSVSCGPCTYNNKDYIYATDSPGIIFSSGYNFGMLQIATSVDDHGHFPEGAALPGTLIIAGGDPSNDSSVPVGTLIEDKHPDFAWGIHGTSGTVYDLDTINTDTKVTQNITSTSSIYPLLLSYYTTSSSTTTAQTVSRSNNLAFNPGTGDFYMYRKGSYIVTPDSSDTNFSLICYNMSNLWVGASQTSTHHHTGSTYISTGYNTSASTGNPTFYASVPNATNTGATNYDVLHQGNTYFQTSSNAATWEAIGITKSGYALHIYRGNGASSTPPYCAGAYASGLVYGGGDTKGFISNAYNSAKVTFGGGERKSSDTSAKAPTWYFSLTGTTATTYNLDDFALAADYLPLAGGTMDSGATVTVYTDQAETQGIQYTSTGQRFKIASGVGWARSVMAYKGAFSGDILGSYGIFGASDSFTNNRMNYFYIGKTYNDQWYEFGYGKFTVVDNDLYNWMLRYRYPWTSGSSTGTYEGSFISLYPYDRHGCCLVVGENTGGLTIVGGGEAAQQLRTTVTNASTSPYGAALSYGTESLMMGADSDLYFVSGASSLTTSDHTEGTNLKTFIWSNAGTLRPWNDNTYSIGAATKRWNYGYFTNISGKLIGTIDSSTTATTQTLPNVTSRVATCQFAWNLYNNSGIFYNDSTDATTAQNNPWQCIAEATVTASGNTYISTTFLIDSAFSSYPGTGIVHFRASIKLSAAESYCVYALKWLTSDTNVNDNTIVFTYKVVSNTSCAVKVWAKAPKRYEAIHIHPLYEATRAAARSSEFWTYNVNSSGVASIPSDEHVMTSTTKQVLLHESASSTATSLECAVTNLFKIWQVVYVCIQNLSYGSGANPMSINFMVPLGYVKAKSNYNTAISTSNPGYYVGEGYNPSNTGSSHTRLLVQWKNDNTIVFTNGSGNRMGIVRIYGIS